MKRDHWDWLVRHLGRCDRKERATCPTCSPAGKKLCASLSLTRKLSPRSLRGQGKTKKYTIVPHGVFESWALGSSRAELAADSLRVTYGLLLKYSRPKGKNNDSRWVWDDFEALARLRGITIETLREHIKALEKLGLVKSFRRDVIHRFDKSNSKTLVLLDLPKWWPGRERFKRSGAERLSADEWNAMTPEEQEEYMSEWDLERQLD